MNITKLIFFTSILVINFIALAETNNSSSSSKISDSQWNFSCDFQNSISIEDKKKIERLNRIILCYQCCVGERKPNDCKDYKKTENSVKSSSCECTIQFLEHTY